MYYKTFIHLLHNKASMTILFFNLVMTSVLLQGVYGIPPNNIMCMYTGEPVVDDPSMCFDGMRKSSSASFFAPEIDGIYNEDRLPIMQRRVVIPKYDDLCSGHRDPDKFKNMIVIVNSYPKCPLYVKAKNAERSGAYMVMFTNEIKKQTGNGVNFFHSKIGAGFIDYSSELLLARMDEIKKKFKKDKVYLFIGPKDYKSRKEIVKNPKWKPNECGRFTEDLSKCDLLTRSCIRADKKCISKN